MCHVRNVPHTPRNNKTERGSAHFAATVKIYILRMLGEIFYCNTHALHNYRRVVRAVRECVGELYGKIKQQVHVFV